MNTCSYCFKEFVYSRKGTKEICPSCFGNRHRWHLKAFMVSYKGGCCQLCGYAKCYRSLDFHHVDPAQKDFGFGSSHCVSWDRIKKELDKCVCLCRNCHGEVHEASERIKFGQEEHSILDRIKAVHEAWVPTPNLRYTRKGWKEYHPAFNVASNST